MNGVISLLVQRPGTGLQPNAVGSTIGGDGTPITNPIFGSGILGRFLNTENPGVAFVQALLPALVSLTFVVGSIVFFFMLLIGAIQWISSGGDKSGLEGAKGKITAALIGIVVLFSVFAIISVIESFFGISILTLDISSVVIK